MIFILDWIIVTVLYHSLFIIWIHHSHLSSLLSTLSNSRHMYLSMMLSTRHTKKLTNSVSQYRKITQLRYKKKLEMSSSMSSPSVADISISMHSQSNQVLYQMISMRLSLSGDARVRVSGNDTAENPSHWKSMRKLSHGFYLFFSHSSDEISLLQW